MNQVTCLKLHMYEVTKLGYEFRDPGCGAYSINTHFIQGRLQREKKKKNLCFYISPGAVTYYLPKIYTASDTML